MTLTQYQDLRFGDEGAFDDFTMALQLNHDSIAKRLGSINVVYPTYPLADVEGSKKDWQQNVQAELQSIYKSLGFAGLPDLTGSDLTKEKDWETFFQLLVYSEMRVNTALGL